MCQILGRRPLSSFDPVTRAIRIGGHSTSIRLEREFWDRIDRLASHEGLSTPALVTQLHDEMLAKFGETTNFTSLLRCVCLLGLEREPVPHAIAAE